MNKYLNIDYIDQKNEFQSPLPSTIDDDLVNEVQKRFEYLINSDELLKNVFKEIERLSGSVVVFGGWVRDQLISIKNNTPVISRDIDVVVDLPLKLGVLDVLPSRVYENIFGGATLKTTTTTLDIWELKNTYLINKLSLESCLSNLPATTVFTINSIVFYPKDSISKPRIIESGFSDSLKNNQLCFQTSHIPYPKIQVARAAIYAAKFSLSFHPDVTKFAIKVCSSKQDIDEIICGLEENCPATFKDKAIEIIKKEIIPNTVFFKHCWGVFEGGGVRAAALAGAYEASTNSGVSFGRVAGTSAGSIVAALIAAGASPRFINNELATKDFQDFMSGRLEKDNIFGNRSLLNFSIQKTSKKYKNLMTIARESGLYSSSQIQVWLDKLLSSLLSIDRTVLFSDLKLPLYVVASDIQGAIPRVWSKETTPSESVAFAVRCSSSIPFFFQPVSDGSSLLVDGGMISNLPAWVFSGETHQPKISRILCFRLKDTSTEEVTDIESFIRSLVSTVIDGGTSIQMQLQSNIYSIDIPTGEYQATDFDKIDNKGKNWLHMSGYQSVKDFITQERTLVGKQQDSIVYKGFDEYLLLLSQHIATSSSNFVLISSDTYWLYFVFPTIALAIQRKVSITVVTEKPNHDDKSIKHEIFRRKQLKNLGVNLTEIERVPFEGVLIDIGAQNEKAIINTKGDVNNGESEYKSDYVRVYSALYDLPVIKSLGHHVKSIIQEFSNNCNLTINSISYDYIYSLLRNVKQYKNSNFKRERVRVDSGLFCLDLYIKEFRLTQVMNLVQAFEEFKVDVFSPAVFCIEGQLESIITPPILERVGDKLFIVEGVTRFFYALQNNIEFVESIVVDNVDSPLPATPHSIMDLSLASNTLDRTDLYKSINPEEFRQIELAMHPLE